MRFPSRRALFLGFLPFVFLCFSVGWWDRIHPIVLGLPFNLFWIQVGIVLTTLCLALTFRLERVEPPDDRDPP